MSSNPRNQGKIGRRDVLICTVYGVAVVATPWIAGCGPTEPTGPVEPPEDLGQPHEGTSVPQGLRLTLRVLLAYRDNILERADMDDIGDKLSDSPYAREVNSRIDSVIEAHVDHLVIVGGQQMPDPNRVAEYLENDMDPADVKEFEALCLQSDAALAEVASCHQILAGFLQVEGNTDQLQHEKLRARIVNGLTQQIEAKDNSVAPLGDDTRPAK